MYFSPEKNGALVSPYRVQGLIFKSETGMLISDWDSSYHILHKSR